MHNGAHGLEANHLPFELDETTGDLAILREHVARANPSWTTLAMATRYLSSFARRMLASHRTGTVYTSSFTPQPKPKP